MKVFHRLNFDIPNIQKYNRLITCLEHLKIYQNSLGFCFSRFLDGLLIIRIYNVLIEFTELGMSKFKLTVKIFCFPDSFTSKNENISNR